jgi:hypothetical protein
MLDPWVRSERVTLWDDSQIPPGDTWLPEIEQAIRQASVAVLMVTRHFLASDFIMERELPLILGRVRSKELQLAWVAVGYAGIEATELKNIQAVNDPARPLETFEGPDRNKAMLDVAKRIVDVASASARLPTFTQATPVSTDYRRCNRADQAREFQTRCRELYEASPDTPRPQGYIITGGQDDAIESFVKRLTMYELPSVLRRVAPDLPAVVAPEPKHVAWPKDRDRLQTQLLSDLFAAFDDPGASNLTPSAFLGLPRIKDQRLVVIYHVLQQLAPTFEFVADLKWYFRKFWGAAQAKGGPLVVTFVAIRCQCPAKVQPMQGPIRPDGDVLDLLQDKLGKGLGPPKASLAASLPSLGPVAAVDVENWLRDYTSWDEEPRQQYVDKLFENAPSRSLNMAAVEPQLKALSSTAPPTLQALPQAV